MQEYAAVCRSMPQYARRLSVAIDERFACESKGHSRPATTRSEGGPTQMPDDGSGGPILMCWADALVWLEHKPRTTALQLQDDNALTANLYKKFPTLHSLNFCCCRWLVGC